MWMVRSAVATLVLATAATFGAANCATYQHELQRAEEHFSHDEHDKALATLRALEPDWGALDTRDRARYSYLRGMTDYRVGFKADARHWLAIASQIDKDSPGALFPSEKSVVNEKLTELSALVWEGDVLPSEEPPGARHPRRVETTGPDERAKTTTENSEKREKSDKKEKSDAGDAKIENDKARTRGTAAPGE